MTGRAGNINSFGDINMAAQNDRRHPHKSTEEPYPHTRESQGHSSRDQGQSHQGRARGQHSSESSSRRGADHSSQPRSSQSSSDNADLKRREYRDEKGEVHHHTRTYMEQHGGKSDK